MPDTSKQSTQKVQLERFLKAVPHLEFSEKGIENISKRFCITPDHLRMRIDQVLKSPK